MGSKILVFLNWFTAHIDLKSNYCRTHVGPTSGVGRVPYCLGPKPFWNRFWNCPRIVSKSFQNRSEAVRRPETVWERFQNGSRMVVILNKGNRTGPTSTVGIDPGRAHVKKKKTKGILVGTTCPPSPLPTFLQHALNASLCSHGLTFESCSAGLRGLKSGMRASCRHRQSPKLRDLLEGSRKCRKNSDQVNHKWAPASANVLKSGRRKGLQKGSYFA